MIYCSYSSYSAWCSLLAQLPLHVIFLPVMSPDNAIDIQSSAVTGGCKPVASWIKLCPHDFAAVGEPIPVQVFRPRYLRVILCHSWNRVFHMLCTLGCSADFAFAQGVQEPGDPRMFAVFQLQELSLWTYNAELKRRPRIRLRRMRLSIDGRW